MINKKLLNVLLCLIIFSSCGMKDSPLNNLVLDLADVNDSCKLNTENLKKILTENVAKDIECLRTSLDQYTKLVLRKEYDYIQKNELEKFVIKFFPETDKNISESLTMLFEFNSLIQNDPKNKISINKLGTIFSILHLVNVEGKIVRRSFDQISKLNYIKKSELIKLNLQSIITKLMSFVDRSGNYTINIKDVFSPIFPDIDLDQYLSYKTFLFGGDKNLITLNEFTTLMNNIPLLLVNALKSKYSSKEYANNNIEFYKSTLNLLKTIKSIIPPQELENTVMDIKDFTQIIKDFLVLDINVEKVIPAVITLKNKLLNSVDQNLTYGNSIKLLEWAETIFGTLYFNNVSFDYHQTELLDTKYIGKLEFTNIKEYQEFNKEEVKYYWTNFIQTIQRFKYFSTDNEFFIYDNVYHRTKKGLDDITIYKFLLKKAVDAYGDFYDSPRVKEITTLGVSNFFYDGEELIRELNLWPEGKFDKTVDKIIRGSDLFQKNSDGNLSSNVIELTEFITTLMNASKINNKLFDKMKSKCEYIDQEDQRFDLSCYRENFFPIFFEELELGKNFPILKTFYDQNSTEFMQKYLINLEIYSRDNPVLTDPISKEELMTLINAFENLETAFIRFDFNGNGLITYEEMNLTYSIFNRFLRDMKEELAPMTDKFVKNILIFMLKKERMPTTIEALSFQVFGKKKNIEATRMSMSAILRFVTELGYP